MTEGVESRALGTLARDVAELRAKYRALLDQLPAVYGFEALWDRFVDRLRPMVAQIDGEAWNPADERIVADVAAVDAMRLDLYSRQSTTLPAYRDPLNAILYTSLRVPSPTFYRLFGPVITHEEVGSMTLQVMSLARFEAQVAEAKADIVRYRLEIEDQIRREGARLHDLQDAVPNLVLVTIRSLLWKNWRRKLVTTALTLLVGALIPPVRAVAAALWHWIRSYFSVL